MPYLSLRGGGGVAHFISKPLRRLIRPLADGWCAIFVFVMIMSAMPNKTWGQTGCNYVCVPSNYKCIIASSLFSNPTSISNFIGTGANDLTPMPGAATTQQGVVIKGWVKVDATYTFGTGSDIVFADSESGLIVSDGATLTFKPSSPVQITTLRGCNVLWGGVYVRANSTVVLEDKCEVYDAYSAINLYHNSKVISTGARYFSNYICIAADRILGDPATINVTASLTGNEFNGGGGLPFYKGNIDLGKPHHAIIANYVNQFSIGATGANIAKNVFKEFQPAASVLQIIPVVASFNTNLTVRNSTFEDIGDYVSSVSETPNIGILASSDNSKVFTLDVKGAGEFGGPTFKNVYTGIECYGTCLKVDQCVFVNGVDHIKVLPTNNPVPPQVPPALSYSITNSSFGGFSQVAISARNVFPAQKFVVSNNTFFDDSSISTGSTAAQFVSNSPIVAQLSIKDNTVAKVSDIVSSGFALTGISNAYVGNNTFVNGSSKSSVELIFNSSKQGTIKENSFSGINDVTDGEYGLLVRNSYATKALCNTFDQLGAGMYLQGNGCDGSILAQNEFGSHNFGGIYLPDFTTIGQQPAYGNKWSVNSSTDEARFELDPLNDPDYFPKLNASKFFIPILESVNPALWAQPRYPGGSDWFTYNNIVQLEMCSIYGEVPSGDDRGLTATDGMVLDRTHPNYGGFAATKWDAQLRLYGKLYTRPDLRPTGSTAATFYTTQQNEPFAQLAVALEQYDQAVAPNTSLNQQLGGYYAQMGSLTQQVADADSVIASGAVVSASLWQTRDGYVQSMDALGQLATDALHAFATSRNTTLAALQTTVNGITTTQTWEANLKSALGILLTGPQATPAWGWTSTQRGTLEGIAAQCAHEGGYGVILSRLMLGDDASNDDNCFSQPRSGNRLRSVAGDVLQVYPNPTTGLLHILHAGEGLLLVRDQTGRTVLEQQSNGVPLVVDLSALSNGMYFLQVVSGSQLSAIHKVFLNR